MSAQNKSGGWLKLTNQLKHADTHVQACNSYEDVHVWDITQKKKIEIRIIL